MLFLASVSALQLAFRLGQQTTIEGDSFVLYGGFILNLLEKFESSGQMSALGRVGCVSIGCYVGYLLRQYELGHIRRWPRWLERRLVFGLAIALSFLLVFLPLIGFYLSKLPAMQHAASKANFRQFIIINLVSVLAWPVLNAILILCATTLYKHISFIRFLGHPFWHSFNKLGLCIYLIHWEVLSYGLTSYEHGPSNGYVIDAVKLWTHSAVFTILFSFAVHLLVEAPLAELLMILGNHFIPKASEQQASKQALKSENKHSMQLV